MIYRNIGCMNSWSAVVWTRPDGSKYTEKNDTTPEAYKKCREAGHKTHETKKGNCWYQVYCDECGLTWDYDCSG